MNKKTKWGIIILIGAGIIGGGIYSQLPKTNDELAAADKVKNTQKNGKKILNVNAKVIKPQLLTDEYTTTGVLLPDEEVDLSFETSGKVVEINFEEGTPVKKGQLLAKVNDRQLQAQLQRLVSQLKLAEDRVFRQDALLKRDAVSKEAYEQVKTDLATLNADIEIVKANIALTELRAPFDGTISKATVDVGSYVGGSLQPVTLATIYKDNQMYAYFNVADNQWLGMLMNNRQSAQELPKKIMVQLGKEGSEMYPATLDYLSPNVDLNTGTLTVRANFDNPQGILKSGLYVSITLPYGEADNAMLVKEASIGTDQLGKYLYLVNDSNIVRYRHIEIGQLIGDTLRQVTGGLSPQDRYVTKALMKVRDGMKIKPMP